MHNRHIEIDAGIFIIDAWGRNKKTWEFMNANKAFCDIFKISQDQVLGLNINNIIPFSIISFHDHLVRDFFTKGHSEMLNSHRVLFGKNSDGYILPIKIVINFSFNQKFGYTFVGLVEKFDQMNLFLDETNKMLSQDFMLLIADKHGVVFDTSESFLKLVKMTLEEWEEYEELRGKKIQLQSFIHDFDNILFEYGISDQIRANDHKNIVNKIVKVGQYEKFTNDFGTENGIQCLMTYFQQSIRYGNGDVKQIQKIILLPLFKHPEYDITQRASIGNFSMKKQQRDNAFKHNDLKTMTSQILQGTMSPEFDFNQEESNEEDQIASMSSMSSTSSSNNSKFASQFDNLKFISEGGNVYYQNVSFKHAVDLFTTYSDYVDIDIVVTEKPDINVTTYQKPINSVKNDSLKLSQLQQTLYYISENGLFGLGELGNQQLFMLMEISDYHNQEEQGPTYLDQNQAKTISQANRLAVIIHQERQKQEQLIEQSQKININFDENDEDNEFSISQEVSENNMQKPSFLSLDSDNKEKKNKIASVFQKQSKKNKNKGVKLMKAKDSSVAINPQIRDLQNGIFQSELSLGSSHSDGSSNKQKKIVRSGKQKANLKVDPKESNLSANFEKKIMRDTFAKKIKAFIFILCIGAFLNTALITSYFQSQTVFSNYKDSTFHLRKYFLREECMYNYIVYMREGIIRNYDIFIRVYHPDTDSFQFENSMDYYFKTCSENEEGINDLRKDIPSYLSNAKELLNGFETSSLCNLTFRNPLLPENLDENLADFCLSVFDGILQNGLTSFVQYLTQFIYQVDLKLENYARSGTYTKKLAFELLDSIQFQKCSDLILSMLPYANDAAQKTIELESKKYFGNAKSEYIMAFALFITFTTIVGMISGYIIYQRIKKRLLDIENMLVLIPLDILEVKLKQQVEQYLKY
eukprot:403341735